MQHSRARRGVSYASRCRAWKSRRAIRGQSSQHRIHGGGAQLPAAMHSVHGASASRASHLKARSVRKRRSCCCPVRFMNESGRAVAEAAGFYKLGVDDVIVLHDEIELSPAKVRVKVGGGIAGHNGLRSITRISVTNINACGLALVIRVTAIWCIAMCWSDFAKSEKEWVEGVMRYHRGQRRASLLRGEDSSFQNKVHLAMAGQGFLRRKDRRH